MSRIVLIGGHGKVALRALPLLTEAGHEVTALFRNPDHTDDVAATGATPRVVDIEQLTAEQWRSELDGFDVVVWSAGAGGGAPERTYAIDRDAAIASMDAAVNAGTNRYVMVSYYGAGPDHGIDPDNSFYAYAEAKSAADEHLTGSPLEWTILRPSRLTLDEGTGRIELGPDAPASEVSRQDVAAVIAHVVDDADTVHHIVEFNNGETPIADAMAQVAQRPTDATPIG